MKQVKSDMPLYGNPDSDAGNSYLIFSVMPCDSKVENCENNTAKLQEFFSKRPVTLMWTD